MASIVKINQLRLSKFMLSLLTHTKIKHPIAKRIILILIGALYPLGFSPFDFWPLTFLSIILLVNEITAFIDHNQSSITGESKDAPISKNNYNISLFSIGLYWGLGAFGLGTSWVYVSIHEFGHAPVIGAIGISFLFVLTLSLVKAAGIHLMGKIAIWSGRTMLLLIIPFAWVLFDFVQSWLFSGFPWLFAGYSQIDGPLWMLSTWTGVYGISWFMMAITSCLVILFRGYFISRNAANQPFYMRPLMFILVVLCSVPLLASLLPQATIESNRKSIKVALVQPNIAQEKKWDRRYFSDIVDVLFEQSRDHWDADLLVWPEGAIPAYKHQVEDIILDLNNRAKESHTDLLLGLPVYHPKEKISYSAFISLGDYQQTYHKQVLVPFGEYLPLGNLLRGLIEFFNLPMSSFSPATTKQQVMAFSDYQVVPAICYEITYAGILHDLISDADANSDKAKIIVTVSNDAWFGDSFGPYQHMQMARMRALELGIPLVRSTNDGISAVVDARGNMLNRLERYTQDTLAYEVSLSGYQTLYRKFGLLSIYLILAISLVVFLIRFLKNR